MDDWDLYRHFLAVARAGTLSAAASELGDSQPTIGRRIDSLERKLGIRLFTRTRRGFTPTPAGEALLEVVGRMEREAENADRLALGSDGGLTGRVRVSASEGLGVTWLIPHLAKLEAESPGLRIDVRIDNSPLDLSRGHADVAVRLNPSSRSDVVGRRVGSLAFGLYASRDYLAARGTPRAANELRRHRIIAPSGVVGRHPLYAWFLALAAGAEEGFTCDSILGQVAAARAGLGIAMISRVVAAEAPELVRVLPRLGRAPDLWIVTHRDLRRTPRIRAVVDALSRAAREDRLRLSGGEGGPVATPAAARGRRTTRK